MSLTLSALQSQASGPPVLQLSQETQLVAACRKGDTRAQQKLYEQFHPMVLGVCLRYATDRQQAKDFMNQAYLRVFQKLDQYRGEAQLGGWIKRVTVSVCLNAVRQKRHQMYEELDTVDTTPVQMPEAMNRLALEDIIAMIQSLPELPRTVFNLFTVEQYTHREIAQELGISESNSRYYLRQARLRLQELVKQQNLR